MEGVQICRFPNLPAVDGVPGVLTGEGGLRGRVQTASGFHGRSCMLNDTGMLNKMAPVCVGNAKRNMICGWVDERQAAKFQYKYGRYDL